MPRARDPNRNRAKEIWQEHRGDITNRQIAELLGVNEKVVAVWKQRDKWNDVHQSDSNVVQQSRKRNGGAPTGNRNAVGNPGGSAPRRNANAVTHGFFRKLFPDDEDTFSIMSEIDVKSPAEVLWDNIVIQYTAIARAQRIMWVQDIGDETKVLKRVKESDSVNEMEWEYQHAWDKQANFLSAQSRAMTALNGLIQRYEEMTRNKLRTEEHRLRVDLMKAELAKLQGDGGDVPYDGFMDAIKGVATEVWSDDGDPED